jgi:putative modified peptide
MASHDDIKMKIEMTGKEYVAFLDKLATDDDFRARLQQAPAETLAAYGIHVDPEEMPSRIVLPSKEGLQDSLGQLKAQGSDIAFIAFPMFLFPRE